MKRVTLTLVLVLAVIALGSIAQADVITFSTSGVFTSGASNIRFGNGTDFIAFNSSGSGCCSNPNAAGIRFNSGGDSVEAPPVAGIELGSFQTIAIGTGATASGTFTLTITQTSPSNGTGSLSGTVTGHFAIGGSGLGTGHGSVTFSSNSVTIGGVTYTL